MLWLTVRNWLAAQNIWRYRRGDAYTDVVITGEYNVMVNSEELIGSTEHDVIDGVSHVTMSL